MINETLVEEKAKEIAELFSDGFQWHDIFQAIGKLMEIAETISGTTGEEKKQFVIDAFERAFDLAAPKLGCFPSFISKPIASKVVHAVVPVAVEWGIAWSNGKFNVNKTS